MVGWVSPLGHSRRVVVHGCNCTEAVIPSGVQQGTVLARIPFITCGHQQKHHPGNIFINPPICWWLPSIPWDSLDSNTLQSPGGLLPMWWVIHMCRGFDPLFSLWQDRARSFWGIFSHPPTPKRSFVVLKLPILTEFDLLGPKFNFSLDLFGSNFQRPAAHPHHFSDRVPPPGSRVT